MGPIFEKGLVVKTVVILFCVLLLSLTEVGRALVNRLGARPAGRKVYIALLVCEMGADDALSRRQQKQGE